MQKTYSNRLKQSEAMETNISHLSLPNLLPPGQKLALSLEIRTLTLLDEGPTLLVQQQFSDNQLRMLVPLLEYYPCYCPYEVLLAYISSNVVTEASIAYCRQRLQEAISRGKRQEELRPIRRALSLVRNKLAHFGLGISNVREMGPSLISLTSHNSF